MKKIILILGLLLFVFCDKKQDIKIENTSSENLNAKTQKPKFENIFENHLYIVGPQLDLDGNLELGCDCCSSEIYFCDSIHFVEIVYCLEVVDLLVGKYSVIKNGVEFQYYDKSFSMEYDFENQTDSLTIYKPIYSEINNKEFKANWIKHKNKKFYNTSNDEVSEQRDSLKNAFVETIHNDKEVLKFLRKNNIKI
jgi:hypothetical protein